MLSSGGMIFMTLVKPLVFIIWNTARSIEKALLLLLWQIQ
jgi:hypothetical protein